ncbi:MAG: hypothetical protein ACRDGI_02830, partial [Candidatus Limnocylindrales bacterium]
MADRRLARSAAVLALFGVVVSCGFLIFGQIDAGIGLQLDAQQRVVISTVARYSPAGANAFMPGMIVTSLDDVTLVELPQFVDS